ncbi:MAG: hypothetical protein LVQ75_04665 [Candidatus Babeliales bacterium]|jgi:hypothetical protein
MNKKMLFLLLCFTFQSYSFQGGIRNVLINIITVPSISLFAALATLKSYTSYTYLQDQEKQQNFWSNKAKMFPAGSEHLFGTATSAEELKMYYGEELLKARKEIIDQVLDEHNISRRTVLVVESKKNFTMPLKVADKKALIGVDELVMGYVTFCLDQKSEKEWQQLMGSEPDSEEVKKYFQEKHLFQGIIGRELVHIKNNDQVKSEQEFFGGMLAAWLASGLSRFNKISRIKGLGVAVLTGSAALSLWIKRQQNRELYADLHSSTNPMVLEAQAKDLEDKAQASKIISNLKKAGWENPEKIYELSPRVAQFLLNPMYPQLEKRAEALRARAHQIKEENKPK